MASLPKPEDAALEVVFMAAYKFLVIG
jgi:hypothetical protein